MKKQLQIQGATVGFKIRYSNALNGISQKIFYPSGNLRTHYYIQNNFLRGIDQDYFDDKTLSDIKQRRNHVLHGFKIKFRYNNK